MYDCNGTSQLVLIHHSGEKLLDCEVLIFVDMSNGAIGNGTVGYLPNCFLKACVERLVVIRRLSSGSPYVDLSGINIPAYAAYSAFGVIDNYETLGVSDNLDELFQREGYKGFTDWYNNCARKIGICDERGMMFGHNKIGITPLEEIISKVPSTIINGIDGSFCTACSNFIQYAEPTQLPYVCFSCRSYKEM